MGEPGSENGQENAEENNDQSQSSYVKSSQEPRTPAHFTPQFWLLFSSSSSSSSSSKPLLLGKVGARALRECGQTWEQRGRAQVVQGAWMSTREL
jgi:hypothetical protein